MSSRSDFFESAPPVENVNRTFDLVLRFVLSLVAVAVIAAAVVLMLRMGESWRNQGGRYLVAVGAFVLLIGVDTQFSRLAWRRFLAGHMQAEGYKRRASFATVLLVFAAVFLFSQAVLLP